MGSRVILNPHGEEGRILLIQVITDLSFSPWVKRCSIGPGMFAHDIGFCRPRIFLSLRITTPDIARPTPRAMATPMIMLDFVSNDEKVAGATSLTLNSIVLL